MNILWENIIITLVLLLAVLALVRYYILRIIKAIVEIIRRN